MKTRVEDEGNNDDDDYDDGDQSKEMCLHEISIQRKKMNILWTVNRNRKT